MRQTKEVSIDGFKFTVAQLPSMKGLRLMHKLSSTLGVALLKSLSGITDIGKGVGLQDLDLGKLGDGVSALFDRFSEDDLETLVKTLFETAQVEIDGKTGLLMPVIDNVLAGKPETIMKLVKFALEVNYGNFFGALLASAQSLSAAPSSATSKT